jgi:hypothetical protein
MENIIKCSYLNCQEVEKNKDWYYCSDENCKKPYICPRHANILKGKLKCSETKCSNTLCQDHLSTIKIADKNGWFCSTYCKNKFYTTKKRNVIAFFTGMLSISWFLFGGCILVLDMMFYLLHNYNRPIVLTLSIIFITIFSIVGWIISLSLVYRKIDNIMELKERFFPSFNIIKDV